MTQNIDPADLVSVEAAADALGWSPTEVMWEINRGALASYYLYDNVTRYVRKSDIKALDVVA